MDVPSQLFQAWEKQHVAAERAAANGAGVRYRAGEPTFTTSESLRTLIGEHTATRYQEDAWHENVSDYVQVRDCVSIDDVFSNVGVRTEHRSDDDLKRIVKTLKVLGFKRAQRVVSGKKKWLYVRTRGGDGDTSGDRSSVQNNSEKTTVTTVTTAISKYNDPTNGAVKETGRFDGDGGDENAFSDLIDGGEPGVEDPL